MQIFVNYIYTILCGNCQIMRNRSGTDHTKSTPLAGVHFEFLSILGVVRPRPVFSGLYRLLVGLQRNVIVQNDRMARTYFFF